MTDESAVVVSFAREAVEADSVRALPDHKAIEAVLAGATIGGSKLTASERIEAAVHRRDPR